MSPFFIALTLTDVLLLTLLVAPRIAWWGKVLAIVVVLSFNFLAWSSVDSGRGWPVRSALPEPAVFVGCEVVEPDIATQEPGRIYVWEIPLDFKHGLLAYKPNHEEPRAYSLPYDRSLHEACETAKKAAAQGAQVGIAHRGGRSGHGHAPGRYIPYLLPTPSLPKKEAP